MNRCNRFPPTCPVPPAPLFFLHRNMGAGEMATSDVEVMRQSIKENRDLHGAAQFASVETIKKSGLFAECGVNLGYSFRRDPGRRPAPA